LNQQSIPADGRDGLEASISVNRNLYAYVTCYLGYYGEARVCRWDEVFEHYLGRGVSILLGEDLGAQQQ
jgi:hypothetical protein